MVKFICTNPAWLVQPSETPEPTSPSVKNPYQMYLIRESEYDALVAERDMLKERLAQLGMSCEDEGCPHYNKPHGHPNYPRGIHGS